MSLKFLMKDIWLSTQSDNLKSHFPFSLSVCVCMFILVFVCLFVFMCVFVYVSLRVYLCVRLSMRMPFSVCVTIKEP